MWDIVCMGKVTKNLNFPSWVSVFVGSKLIKEFTDKRKAFLLARRLAKGLPQGFNEYIEVDGKLTKLKD